MTAVASYGFDSSAGLVWSGLPEARNLREMLEKNPGLSPRVRFALADAYAIALKLIAARKAAVEALANALLDKRALDGSEVNRIIAQHPAGPEAELARGLRS